MLGLSNKSLTLYVTCSILILTLRDTKKIKNLKEIKVNKNLTMENLSATYYDEAMNQYTLEFFDGTLVDVDASVFEGMEIDEWFFDDEENVNLAVREGEIREN